MKLELLLAEERVDKHSNKFQWILYFSHFIYCHLLQFHDDFEKKKIFSTQIFDGDNDSDGSWKSEEFSGSKLPHIMVSSSNMIMVRFNADGHAYSGLPYIPGNRGFKAEFSSVPLGMFLFFLQVCVLNWTAPWSWTEERNVWINQVGRFIFFF